MQSTWQDDEALAKLIEELEGLRDRGASRDDADLGQAFGVPPSEVARCRVALDALAAGAPARRTPQRLGEYELRGVLGRGGMGVVHRAWHPRLLREVAIKVVDRPRAGADERFAIEARAAARLRHPHIVAIHDVGEHEGRPFIVMDLVEGEPLAARIRREPLLPDAAATIAAKLARALQSAHERLILHRDVKPQNVLLTRDGEPLLADFGLAKDLAAKDGITESGLVLGTPAYMAPEQARGDAALIDRRTDVYAVGATLHEMLAGRPPFQAETPVALLQRIAQDDPPRLASVDADLEAICLTCLEKEPERRYPTAGALAEDLERWLRREPIRARRRGAVYRARRWLRRNAALARTLLGVALVVSIGGVASAAAFVTRLKQERDAASLARREAVAAAGEARRQEERARREEARALEQAALAQRQADVARHSLDLLIYEVQGELGNIANPQVRAARQRLLRGALRGLEELRGDAPAGAVTNQDLAAAIQEVQLAMEVGDQARRLAASERFVAQCQRAMAQRPLDRSVWRYLAMALVDLAERRREQGDLSGARTTVEEAIAWARALGTSAEDPPPRYLVVALQVQADLLLASGQPGVARDRAREALDVARAVVARDPSPRGTATVLAALFACGEAELQNRELDVALARYVEAESLARQNVADEPGKLSALSDLSKSLLGLGDVCIARGEPARAEASLLEGVELLRQLHEQDPMLVGAREAHVRALLGLGDVLRDTGQLERARPVYEEALVLARQLAGEGTAGASIVVCAALESLGTLHRRRGDFVEARRCMEESLATAREGVAGAPEDLAALHVLAGALLDLGTEHSHTNDRRMAGALLEEARELYERLAAHDPTNAAARLNAAIALSLLGDLVADLLDVAPSRERWEQAADALRFQVTTQPADAAARWNLTRTLAALGDQAANRTMDLEAAATYYAEAIRNHAPLVAADAREAVWVRQLESKLARVNEAREAPVGERAPSGR